MSVHSVEDAYHLAHSTLTHSSVALPATFSTLARRLEPHLPLIKSRTLNAFYDALRKGNDPAPHLLALHKEAQQDYRLRRLLAHIIPS